MIVAGKQFPDECPSDCKFRDEIKLYGQQALCMRCPVLICPELVDYKDYRPDWAKEWYKFFDSKGQHFPELYL